MIPRHSFVSPEATERMAEDLYDGIAKLHARFFAVKFENAADPQKPLVIYPPKGVSVSDYREALLLRTDIEDVEHLVGADSALKVQIRDAFQQQKGDIPVGTIGRTLIKTILFYADQRP